MRPRRNWGARLHEYAWEGMRVLFLENEELRVGINATRGGELFELDWKPGDVDFAWLSGHALAGSPPPVAVPDPELAFLHHYPGGWQEVFPNGGAPSTYGGVRFGQHDEVWQLPWDVEVVHDDPQTIAIALTVHAVRVPCRLRKELRLRAGRPRLELRETVENLSGEPVAAMWGHHITFGPPFLREGCRIVLPEVHDPSGLGLRVAWDAAVLPYLWFWQEFGAWRRHPWFGRHYNIGLEPFSSYPTNGLAEAVRNGSALELEPHGRCRLTLTAEVVHD